MSTPSPEESSGDPAANDEHSKVTADVIKAAMALAQRDVDLGLITVEQIESIPRTRFAPVERKKIAEALSARGMSNRAIAKVTGASPKTIDRDLGYEPPDASFDARDASNDAAQGNGGGHDQRMEWQGAPVDTSDPEWREKEWAAAGMPSFSMSGDGIHRRINVLFASEEDVKAFSELIKQPLTDKTKSVWFPPKPKQSRKDLMFHSRDEDPPLP